MTCPLSNVAEGTALTVAPPAQPKRLLIDKRTQAPCNVANCNTVHLMGFKAISGKRSLGAPLTRLRAEVEFI